MEKTKFTASMNKTKQNPGERYFSWYCDELIAEGYLKRYDREPETIKVLPAFSYRKEKHLKTKDNVFEPFNLLGEANYTYDFRLIWTEKALYLFTEVIEQNGAFRFNKPPFISHNIRMGDEIEIVSYVDVKPHSAAARFGGGKLSTFYTFPFIQKFLLNSKGLYINKIIPKNEGKHGINTCLFATTFIPNRFRFTDGGEQERKIHFKKISLSTFIRNKQSIIDKLNKAEELKNLSKNQGTLL